jgi:hypothetical protein
VVVEDEPAHQALIEEIRAAPDKWQEIPLKEQKGLFFAKRIDQKGK